MLKKLVAVGALIVGLGACQTTTGANGEPFNRANCYERVFNVYFEGDVTTLSTEATEAIDLVGNAVHGCRIQDVQIVGQADATEDTSTTEEVSVARARAVRDYMEHSFHWSHDLFALRARGDAGAVTDEGLANPLRSRARVVVRAVAPD